MAINISHPNFRGKRFGKQRGRSLILELERKQVVITAGPFVKKKPKAKKKIAGGFRFRDGMLQRLFARSELRGPAKEVDIANTPCTFLDIRFEMVDSVAEFGMASRRQFSESGQQLPGLTTEEFRQTACEGIEQFSIAPYETGIEETD